MLKGAQELIELRKQMDKLIEQIDYQIGVLDQNRSGFLKRLESLDFELYEHTLTGHYGMTLASLITSYQELKKRIERI